MARIYLEGGGQSKDLRVRCRRGFRKLLERCGLGGRMPRLVACGGRQEAYDRLAGQDFGSGEYLALWVDSEQPVKSLNKPWAHVQQHDRWKKPPGATDDNLLLVVTCLESWLAADPQTLQSYFGSGFRPQALPAVNALERTNAQATLARLEQATARSYSNGKATFDLLARINPQALSALPGFRRCRDVLRKNL